MVVLKNSLLPAIFVATHNFPGNMLDVRSGAGWITTLGKAMSQIKYELFLN